jgi:hypothetical protein
MADSARQVPAPRGAGWLLDLTEVRGPLLVVLRCDEREAIEAASAHLADIRAVSDPSEARELIEQAVPHVVAVIW